MRRLLRPLLAVLAACAALACGPAAAQGERILSFDADVAVQPDGALSVIETIEVTSAGREIRRGIFRDFPLRALTADGLSHRVGFEIVRVERGGRPEPYRLADLDAGVRIYIGREDVLLEPGRHRYTIEYLTTRQLLHRDGEDELYWNVTGDAWAFPIDRASVTVRLPGGRSADQVAAYTGPRGATGRDVEVFESGGSTVRIATTRVLAPSEGFTIAVVWPEGAVERPSRAEAFGALVHANKGVLIGAGLVVVLLGYFALAWHRVGRDPAKGVIIPLFEAPDRLSPVATGYIWNQGFGGDFHTGRAMTVALTSLATKGRIVIEDAGDGEFTLSRRDGDRRQRKAFGDALPPGERAVHGALFADGRDSVSFGTQYEPVMGAASTALLTAFNWEYGRAYFRRNSGFWLLGALIAVAATWSGMALDTTSEDAMILASVMTGFATVFYTVALALVGEALWGTATALATGGPLRPLHRLGQLMAGLFALAGVAVMVFMATDFVAPAAFVPGALAIPIAVAFWHLLKAPTRLGRKTLDAIEGYRRYLSVAEAGRLNMAGREPPVTEALFEAHLPYAMALGVEEEWSAKVMARLDTSTDDPSRSRSTYSPRWYHGGGGTTPQSLAGALSRNLGGASGGSSGGGGGGGGGW
jgi:uncharacterized membrane protein YgcG